MAKSSDASRRKLGRSKPATKAARKGRPASTKAKATKRSRSTNRPRNPSGPASKSRASPLQELLESLDYPLVVLDRQGRVQHFSPKAREVVGLESGDIGRAFCDVMKGISDDALLNDLEQVLEKLAPIEAELRAESDRWFLRKVAPYRSSRGKVNGVVVTFADVTEQKRASRTGLDIQRRFEFFMQNLPGLAWIKDLDGRYVYANAAAHQAFGKTREELLGKSDPEVFPPDTAALFRANDGAAVSSGAGIRTTETLRHSDGKVHSSLVAKFPIADPEGRPCLVGGMAIDITDYKRAADSERYAQQQLQVIADSMAVAVTRCSRDLRYLWANRQYLEWLGRREEEVVGHPIVELVGPQVLETIRPKVEQALAGESVSFEVEINYSGKGLRWIKALYSPTRDAAGEVDGWVAALTDVTDSKRIERELQGLNASLERQVEERTELLRMVHDITVVASQAISVEEAMRFALQRICRRGDWQIGHVNLLSEDGAEWISSDLWQFAPGLDAGAHLDFQADLPIPVEGDHWIAQVGRTCQPMWVEGAGAVAELADRAEAWNVKTGLAFPVFAFNQVAAVLELHSAHSLSANERFLAAIQDIGIHLGRVIERKRLEKQVAESSDAEQRRLSAELHASLGQQIGGISLMANALLEGLKAEGSRHDARMGDLVGHIEKVKAKSRTITKDLMPVEIDCEGLPAALEELADETEKLTHIRCAFEGNREFRSLDSFTSTQLFRIAQEAIHNAAKHAAPRRITVGLTSDGSVKLWVKDDGTGIEPSALRKGRGIQIMRHRASLIGGVLEIDSLEGGGTMVSCIMRRILIG